MAPFCVCTLAITCAKKGRGPLAQGHLIPRSSPIHGQHAHAGVAAWSRGLAKSTAGQHSAAERPGSVRRARALSQPNHCARQYM